MKRPLLLILACLLCCALLCACGGKKTPDVVPAPTRIPADTPTPAASVPMTEAEQRVFIEHSRGVWQPENLEYESWFYALTDLDRNGRLEVLTASLQGSGLYTYVNCYEMNESCTALVRCPDNTGEGMAWPDIIKDTLTSYRDPVSGRVTYVCEDMTRDGAAHYQTAQESFCLENGQISVRVLAVMDEQYGADGSSVKTYYDGSYRTVSEQEYNSLVPNSFAGQEPGSLTLKWTQLEAQAQPTAQPQFTAQPQYTPQPQYTQQPVNVQPQASGPVTITKNPTSESLAVGGKTWFIAHADNATSLTWLATSPQGQVYTLDQAMAANPGLVLQALEQDTLAVSNVPKTLDGWSFQARFDGPGGSAVTSPASIHVDDYVTAYGQVISNYYRAYNSGNTGAEYAWSNGLSEYIGYSSHVGYALQDLSGDGVPELIIAGTGENNNSSGVIYDLYTLVNGQPVQLAFSQARNRYLLRSDGSILNEGSGGAGHTVYVLNRVQGSELVPCEAVFTYFDGQPNDGYYHQRDSYSYEPRDYDEYITELEFNYFVGLWEDSVTVPALTPIF